MIVIRSPATHGAPCVFSFDIFDSGMLSRFWSAIAKRILWLLFVEANLIVARKEIWCLKENDSWSTDGYRMSRTSTCFILKSKQKWMWNASHARPVVKFAKARRNLFLLQFNRNPSLLCFSVVLSSVGATRTAPLVSVSIDPAPLDARCPGISCLFVTLPLEETLQTI